MANLKLNKCGDLDVSGGRLSLVSGVDEVRQNWLIRMRTIAGEWFLDQEVGIPYLPGSGVPLALTDKPITRQRVQAVFAAATRATPGIKTVDAVIVGDLDPATRQVQVTVYATTIYTEDSQEFVFAPADCGAGAAAVAADALVLVAGGAPIVLEAGGASLIL